MAQEIAESFVFAEEWGPASLFVVSYAYSLKYGFIYFPLRCMTVDSQVLLYKLSCCSYFPFSINEIYSFGTVTCSDEHPESVLTSMQTIMTVLLEESEDIHEDLILILLSVLGRNKKVSCCFLQFTLYLPVIGVNVLIVCTGGVTCNFRC